MHQDVVKCIVAHGDANCLGKSFPWCYCNPLDMSGSICAPGKCKRRPSSFSYKTNFVIQEGRVDWFEILTFDGDGMAGEVKSELADGALVIKGQQIFLLGQRA